jgi:pilus assembly protein CpaD
VKIRLHLVYFAALLTLPACVAEYSKSEAPDELRVDGAESRREVAFAAGSAYLPSGELRKIDQWVLSGSIRAADRVEIAAGGPPGLAERRAAAISSELLRYGIVATALPIDIVPANRAVVSIGRYAVTLPTCPNWSQSLSFEFTNALTSNYGCANATNLGLMVASPADLVSGRPRIGTAAQPAADAVQRYLTDRVKRPPPTTASPFAGAAGGGDSGGGAAAGGGAPGAATP